MTSISYHMPGMPKQLYYIGSFPDDAKPTAAIVGARLCSPYGRIQAFNYGKFLSEHGVQVISGMAAGIDAEGHKGALEGGTPTFAVLGNGVDICYPSSSRGIYRRVCNSCSVVDQLVTASAQRIIYRSWNGVYHLPLFQCTGSCDQ